MALLLLLALLPLALPWRIGLLRRPLLPLVAVAALAGFARWPSSGSAYRLWWATWGGCRAQGHSFSRPSMAKFADFLLWLPRSQGFRFSSIGSYRLMLSYRFTLSFGPSSAPFGCLPIAGLFALLLGPLRYFFAIYLPRRSHRFVRLLSAHLSRWFFLCGLSDSHPYCRASAALPVVFHSSEVTPVCHLSLHLLPCVRTWQLLRMAIIYYNYYSNKLNNNNNNNKSSSVFLFLGR